MNAAIHEAWWRQDLQLVREELAYYKKELERVDSKRLIAEQKVEEMSDSGRLKG